MLKKLFKKYARSWKKDYTTPAQIKKLVELFVADADSINKAEEEGLCKCEVIAMWDELNKEFDVLPEWLQTEMNKMAKEMGIY